jgi:hypothetical protein
MAHVADAMEAADTEPLPPIKINPKEELLKGIAIVHGEEVASQWRYVTDQIEKAMNAKLDAFKFDLNKEADSYYSIMSMIQKFVDSLTVDKSEIKFELITRTGADENDAQFNIQFGNLHTALLFRGIMTSPDVQEYTDDMGNRYTLGADGDLQIQPRQPLEYISVSVTVNPPLSIYSIPVDCIYTKNGEAHNDVS